MNSDNDCESGCLYGEDGKLFKGSTGLRTKILNCSERHQGNRKCKAYETCASKQCQNFSKITVLEFAKQICMRAKQFDNEIVGQPAVQQVGDDG